MLRWGGNPQDASLWLLGLSAVVGLLVVSGIRWLFGLVAALAALGQASPTQRLVAVIDWTLAILNLLILVRFIGGWLGVSPHVWLMRVARRLTEWLIAPIRRALPRFAMIDLSPAVAYLLILLVRAVVIRSLATL